MGLAAVVGIPVGFMIGRFSFEPHVQPAGSLMRPVSPLNADWPAVVFKGPTGRHLDDFHLL
jgi:hypothetical protein